MKARFKIITWLVVGALLVAAVRLFWQRQIRDEQLLEELNGVVGKVKRRFLTPLLPNIKKESKK